MERDKRGLFLFCGIGITNMFSENKNVMSCDLCVQMAVIRSKKLFEGNQIKR